jgi:hypothetical protein
MFPPIARKQDISHLEEHHHQLESELEKFGAEAKLLRKVEEMSSWNRSQTSERVVALQTLVTTHEAAEEAVVCTENLKKLFTLEEFRESFPF